MLNLYYTVELTVLSDPKLTKPLYHSAPSFPITSHFFFTFPYIITGLKAKNTVNTGDNLSLTVIITPDHWQNSLHDPVSLLVLSV